MSTENNDNLEIWLGLFLAIFAAILAVNELGAGKYGADELIAHNKASEQLSWYQSKSIKQSLAEGQRDLLLSLEKAGAIQPGSRNAMDSFITKLESKVDRYQKEKQEILKGSAVVGKDNWAQDVDGEFGKVIGAEEWQKAAEQLGNSGDIFDLATLFLQVSLVLGAIGIVVRKPAFRRMFLGLMILSGGLGTWEMIQAWISVA